MLREQARTGLLPIANGQIGRVRGQCRERELKQKTGQMEDKMKVCSILFAGSALLVASALAINQPLAGERGDGSKAIEGSIPFPAGQFSFTSQGSFAICLDPSTFAEEPCTTGGALVLPLAVLDNGASVFDKSGNSCTTYTQVNTDLPVDASPPSVTANIHLAGKPLDYDSSTGTGDNSITGYTGGSCNGATFDGSGATEIYSATAHFVVSEGGNRLDSIITALTNPANSIGAFFRVGDGSEASDS